MISIRKRSEFPFDRILLLISLLVLSSCSFLPNPNVKDFAKIAALKAAQPSLEKVFLAEAPISPPSRSQYPTIEKLPGAPFNPELRRDSLSFDSSGNLLLESGDYSFPVMTYCMRSWSSSPAGHSYVLASLQGKRSKIIREISAKALENYSPQEIQFLSWNLQAGLSYGELTQKSKAILDSIDPSFKNDLKESFVDKIEQQWNSIASKSAGLIPDFYNASNELLDELGEIGKTIENLRDFRDDIRNGVGFDELRNRIYTTTHPDTKATATSWSKISDGVYARFITEKGFLSIGQIQVRVLPIFTKRNPSSHIVKKQTLDLHSLIADPRDLGIQPLTFSLILWPRGMAGAAVLVEPPVITAALLATILAAQYVNWDSFLKLRDLIGTPSDSRVKKIIEDGNRALNEELDKLEKPLRDLKVVDRKTKNTSSSKGPQAKTREYTKNGGEKELQKDFDKIPGKASKASDGVEKKNLPNGETAIKRPKELGKTEGQEKTQEPTLEIQPSVDANGERPKFRVKVRYVE